MPNVTLPTVLDPTLYTLALTPGSYSEIVIDNLGVDDWNTNPDLAAADDAAIALSTAGDEPGGISDAIASLGGVQSQITQGNGGAIVAALGPASNQLDSTLKNFNTLVPPTVDPTLPGAPPNQTTPTAPAGFSPGATFQSGTLSVSIASALVGGTPVPGDTVSIVVSGVPANQESNAVIPGSMVFDGSSGYYSFAVIGQDDQFVFVTNAEQADTAYYDMVIYFENPPAGAGTAQINIYVFNTGTLLQQVGVYFTAA